MGKSLKFLGFIEALGRLATFIALMVKFAKKHGLTDEEFGKIATGEGEPLIEEFVLSLKSVPVEKPVPSKIVKWEKLEYLSTIRNKLYVIVDRETPLEEQFAQLAEEKKIRDDLWGTLNSEHYPSDKSRPTEIMLGECNVGRTIAHGVNTQAVVAGLKGVIRNADPYEFAAWLRAMPKAGVEYSLAALDQTWPHPTSGRPCAPHAYGIGGGRSVGGDWAPDEWLHHWFFLVVCE